MGKQWTAGRAERGADDQDFLDEFIADADASDRTFRGALDDAQERSRLLLALTGLRRKLGLRQADLATRMRTTQSAVSEFENSLADPRLSTLQRYCRALDVRLVVSLAASPTSFAFSAKPDGVQRHFARPSVRNTSPVRWMQDGAPSGAEFSRAA